jgi:putative ABC transport system permease protein
MVIRQGLWLALLGLVTGIFLASFALQILNPLLFGIGTFDVPTLMCISLAILGLTTLASYLPSRHAAAINPIIALRSE